MTPRVALIKTPCLPEILELLRAHGHRLSLHPLASPQDLADLLRQSPDLLLVETSEAPRETQTLPDELDLATLEKLPFPAMVLQRSGEPLFFNRLWIQLTGQSSEWKEALGPEDRPLLEAQLQKHLASGRQLAHACHLRLAHEIRPHRFELQLHLLSSVWLGCWLDLEAAESSPANEWQRQLLEHACDGLCMWNLDRSTVQIFGRLGTLLMAPGKLQPMDESEFLARLAADDRSRFQEQIRHSLDHHLPLELEVTTSGPTRRTLLFRSLECLEPVSGSRQMVAMIWDQSERNRSWDELRRAREAAEEANRAKESFLAVLSHELRNPLMPVLSIASVLENDPNNSPELREALEVIRRNVELEGRLIDDLLDITRINRGKLPLNRDAVDAHTILRHALEICQSEIQTKNLQLIVELQATHSQLWADPARLQQIYWNLIKNSVKFTPPGGRIQLRSRNEKNADDESQPLLVIEIQDTGIGIDPGCLGRIFRPYEQGEPEITRRFGGLGLGLPISKALVEAHGGQLTAQSPGKNKGCTFSVRMTTRAKPAEQPAKEPPSQQARPAHPTRILLVDDHADTRYGMRLVLEKLGYQVQTAESATTALALAAQESFDIIISDIGLPDQSGLELIQELHRTLAIKGIALSGFGMEEDIRKSFEAGFSEHLTKPVNFHRLESVLRHLAE